jgi:hypothetical protein
MRGTILQRTSTDEVGPRADLGGNALSLGELLAHALSEENGSLGLHEKRDTKIDSIAAHNIILVNKTAGTDLGQVEDTTDVVLLEDLAESTLVLLGELDDFDLDTAILGVALKVVLDSFIGSEELVAQRVDIVDNLSKIGVVDVSTEEETLTRLGAAEVHHRLSGSPVSLNKVLSEASHFTSRRHLDTKIGIGTSKTSPRELGNLDSEVITLVSHEVDRLRNVSAGKSTSGNINEVGTENLGHEGERTGSTEVALDDLERRFTTVGVVGVDDLHVEGTSDLPGFGNLVGNDLDTLDSILRELGRRENKRSITRMDTSVFDVLTDSVDKDLTVVSNSVDVDFAGTFDELSNNDGVVRADFGGGVELLLELGLGANDSHGSTGQDVRGSDENGVTDSVGELLSLSVGSEFAPGRLVNVDRVENRRELLTVFGLVNVLGIGTENLSLATFLKLKGDVLRELTTDRDDDTRSSFKFVNIHDTFVREFLKVELVGNIEIGTVGFCAEVSGVFKRSWEALFRTRVVVDHDSLLALLLEGESSVDSTPIKFDRRSNTWSELA